MKTKPTLVLAITLTVIANLMGKDPAVLRYVRPAGEAFVTECEIFEKRTAEGKLYQSITQRPNTTMDLRIHFDRGGSLVHSELTQKSGNERLAAEFAVDGKTAVVKRADGRLQRLSLAEARLTLATTAPDWSDIFLLLRTYDRARGGKQLFAGLWYHPTQQARILDFEVEPLGKDDIGKDGKALSLQRFRVHLRSGDYIVWADAIGLVYKLMPPGQPERAVILGGFEKATMKLGGKSE